MNIPKCKECPHHYKKEKAIRQEKMIYSHYCDLKPNKIDPQFFTKRETSPKSCPLRSINDERV